MQVTELLDKVEDEIQQNGLAQYTFEDSSSFCVVGAICHCAGERDVGEYLDHSKASKTAIRELVITADVYPSDKELDRNKAFHDMPHEETIAQALFQYNDSLSGSTEQIKDKMISIIQQTKERLSNVN